MTCAERPRLRLNTWSHLAATYNGSALTLYLNGVSIGTLAGDRCDHDLDRRAADRRQHDLAGVVPGRHRRGAGLQPRAQRGGDPDRHERERRQPRRNQAPTPPGALDAVRRHQLRSISRWTASTDNVGVTPLQRPPLDDRRLHAERGEPDRARRPSPSYSTPGSRPARTTTASPPRMPPATCQHRLERSELRRHRGHHGPERADILVGDRLAQLRRARLGRRRRTTSASPATTSTARRSAGFTPSAAQPDRAADRDELHGHRARRRHVLLRRHGRGRRRQPLAAFERGECRRDGRHRGALDSRDAERDRWCQQRRARAGAPRPTTSPSAATTSTARRPPGSRRAPQTGSRSRRRPATPIPRCRWARTTTVSRLRTQPATSARRHRRRAPSVTGDVTAPTAPGGLTANGSSSSVALAWTASTDNVGVTRYNVHRSTTTGFTPSAANRIAQPTGTSYTDSGLSAGTYYYRVIAEDAASNLSAPSAQVAGIVSAAPPSGLVAAYAMDENGGTTIGDKAGYERRDGLRSDLGGGQVRLGALVRRGQRHRQHPRRGEPRPDDGHDPRGVGEADDTRIGLANGPAQGAAGELRVRPLWHHGTHLGRAATSSRAGSITISAATRRSP